MKINLNGNTVYVDFYKRHVCRPRKFGPDATWNEVIRLGQESLGESIERYKECDYETSYKTCCRLKQDDNVLANGKTVLNPNDKADRFTGKKIALERALNNGTHFNKEERKAIWHTFLSKFGHLAK